MKDIKKAIQIEKIHRYVFDKIYVQDKNGVRDEVDDADYLKKYDNSVASYPNFREDLYNFDNKKFIRYRYK